MSFSQLERQAITFCKISLSSALWKDLAMGLLMRSSRITQIHPVKGIENLSWVIYHGNTQGRKGEGELEEAEKAPLSLQCSAGRMPEVAAAAAATGRQGCPNTGMDGLL